MGEDIPDFRIITDRTGEREAELELEVPTDIRLIEGVVSLLAERCRAFDFQGPRLNLNLRVGVTEALANAMLYGNRRDTEKPVFVLLRIDESRICIRVGDQGKGFEPDAVPDPTDRENRYRSRGRGIFLIRKLMDEVRFNDRGNEVFLVLHRTS